MTQYSCAILLMSEATKRLTSFTSFASTCDYYYTAYEYSMQGVMIHPHSPYRTGQWACSEELETTSQLVHKSGKGDQI